MLSLQSFQRLEMLGICAVALCAGCGGPSGPVRYAVKGTVNVNGTPLSAGTIRFVPAPETKGPAAAGTISNGQFEIDRSAGPVEGAYRVEIEQELATTFAIDDEAAYAQAFQETKGKALPKQEIPPRYNRQTELTANITPDKGAHVFTYDLEVKTTTTAKK